MQKLKPRIDALEKTVSSQDVEVLAIEVCYFQESPDGERQLLTYPCTEYDIAGLNGQKMKLLFAVLPGLGKERQHETFGNQIG